jgi:hypothetical protein
MELKVVISGQPIGNYTSDGCSACLEIVPVGHAMMLIDDGEYWPTICIPCVGALVDDLNRKGFAIAAKGRPDSTAPG